MKRILSVLILASSVLALHIALTPQVPVRQVVVTDCWQVGQSTYCHWEYVS